MNKINIVLVILFSLAIASCNTNQAHDNDEHENHEEENIVFLTKQQQAALGLKLGNITMRNLTTIVKINGQLEVSPENKAVVTAIMGGNVKEISVFNGDRVSKGQVLAVLEHPDYISLQEDFAVIAHNLNFSEKEYLRQKELYENNVSAGKNYQKALAEYSKAKAKYNGLKTRLELLNLSPSEIINGNISSTIKVLSPISGFVNEVNIKLGTYVDAQYKMFEIADNSRIHADFMVYENDIHLLRKGQLIHFTVSNRPEKEYVARIFAIGKRFDSDTRALHIHSSINQNVDGLIPGMYITGHLHADSNYVKTLPDDAIVRKGVKSYIFVLDKQKHNEEEHNDSEEEHTDAFMMVEVIPGLSNEGYTEVRFIKDLPDKAQVVMNQAYYLLSDMGKEEMEHEH